MKKCLTLLLTAGMLLGAVTGASAIEFKAKGQFNFGFGVVDTQFTGDKNGDDLFAAQQRVRLQLDVIASESLSGTVFFEMGDTTWGKGGDSGGALGADGKIVELKRAYIDWYVPNSELSFRMGIQGLTLPNAAGGPMVLDDDVAGIVASYKINDSVSIAAAWARPYNDNFGGETNYWGTSYGTNYLDNIDVFALMVPISGNGWSVTPWLAAAAIGENSLFSSKGWNTAAGYPISNAGIAAGKLGYGMLPYGVTNAMVSTNAYRVKDAPSYGTAIWAGIPVKVTANNWNFEFDFNYGDTGYLGTVDDYNHGTENVDVRRSGWIAKALVEYKMDWGTPGLFAWYGSGDDEDAENGSEMMPYLNPTANFTSFMGDGDELGWSASSGSSYGYDNMLTYAGTWGIGAHIKKMSFVEDLSHTFRVAYWGGTNSTSMAKHLKTSNATQASSMYLTTNDYMLEFNLDSTYQIYENLQAIVQLGYIVNGVDEETWDHLGETRDAYKAQLIFSYSF